MMTNKEIQTILDNIMLDTSRISCFASFTDELADKVSEYDSEMSEQLFSIADAIKMYSNKIDEKVGKLYHISDNHDPKINHNE